MQVKQKIVSTILYSSSQNKLMSYSIVEEMGLEVGAHLDPYNINGHNQESFDKVTKKCTFKFYITKKFVDEIICDVVSMVT